MNPPGRNRRAFLKTAAATASVLPFCLQAGGQDVSRKPERPQFSLAHLTVVGCAPPEMTYLAARVGYDFVSYRLITMHLPGEPIYDLTGNQAMLRQTRTTLAETGLKVHDVELARIQDGVDVKSYVPVLETAAELGAHHVITSIWTADRNYEVNSLAALCDAGRKLDLTMNLEFVTWANVASFHEAVAICRSVRRDNLGL